MELYEMQIWTVDECPDANGTWTIRVCDGTPNGDTDTYIATVATFEAAQKIVEEYNSHL